MLFTVAGEGSRYALVPMSRTRILGTYLAVAGILQALLYFAMSVKAKQLDWLFYFDPRIGIFYFETAWQGANESVVPTILRWFTAAWILLLAGLLLGGRPLFKTYMVSEIILFLPSLMFFFLIIGANLNPAHGFSVGELLFPGLVALLFSVVPLILAFCSWRQLKTVPNSVGGSTKPLPLTAR